MGKKLGSTVRIAFNRPNCLNAFRPQTVDELFLALDDARQNPEIGCVILTGNGPSTTHVEYCESCKKDHGKYSFSSGGDQRIRGKDGYKYTGEQGTINPAKIGTLAYFRSSASHSLYAQNCNRSRTRLGCWWRT